MSKYLDNNTFILKMQIENTIHLTEWSLTAV